MLLQLFTSLWLGCCRCDASHVNNRYANWNLYVDRRSVYFRYRDMDGFLRVLFVHVTSGICFRHSVVSCLTHKGQIVLEFI